MYTTKISPAWHKLVISFLENMPPLDEVVVFNRENDVNLAHFKLKFLTKYSTFVKGVVPKNAYWCVDVREVIIGDILKVDPNIL